MKKEKEENFKEEEFIYDEKKVSHKMGRVLTKTINLIRKLREQRGE